MSTEDAYERSLHEYSQLKIQKLFDINDKNYTQYRPVVDPTADAYITLRPCISGSITNGDIVGIYIPEYIEQITLLDCSSSTFIPINLTHADTPPIEIILSQTRSLPLTSETEVDGYKRIVLASPCLCNCNFVLYSDTTFIYYVEQLHYKSTDAHSWIANNKTVCQMRVNDQVIYRHPSRIHWFSFDSSTSTVDANSIKIDTNPVIMDQWRGLSYKNDALYTLRQEVFISCYVKN